MFQDDNHDTHIEEDDQCFTCEWYQKQKCPLLDALAEKVVLLGNDIAVTGCEMYREFRRVLRLVKGGPDPNTDHEPPEPS